MTSTKLLYLAVFVGAIALVVGGTNVLSAQAAPEGTLIGWCVDNGTSPYIYLEWGSNSSANSNGLQKADVSPSEDRFWGWLGTYDTQRSYTDYTISRGQTYWYRVKYRPELPSNVISVSCPITPTPTVYPTPTPYPSLTVWPTTQTVDSGQTLTIYAYGGTGSYFWTSPGGSQTTRYGQSVSFWYTNNTGSLQTYTVAVTSGTQTQYATVYVRSVYIYPTPTPTIYPTPTPTSISCSHNISYISSGAEVRLDATGYGSYFSWNAPYGYPSIGNGTPFRTRFYNSSGSTQSRWITVTNGYQTATCEVRVSSDVYPTPYPTWYPTPYPTYYPTPYPTWYPTPVPGVAIELTHVGRNVTRGQSGEYASVIAGGNDTLDLIVRVRNTTGNYLYNVVLTDVLPAGIYPIAGSTTVNNQQVGDGIASNGINIGTLAGYATTTVKLSVRVDPSAVPSWGSATTSNVMQVRADGIASRSVLFRITLSNNASVLASISSIATGVEDSLIPALAIALVAMGSYGAYTRTNIFRRRASISEIKARAGETANFSR